MEGNTTFVFAFLLVAAMILVSGQQQPSGTKNKKVGPAKGTAATTTGGKGATKTQQNPAIQQQIDPNSFPEDSHAKGFFSSLVDSAPKSTDYIDPAIRNNVKLPFKTRFGVRERSSNKFHYPALPSVYWSTHKRPFVPVVEPKDDDDN